MTDVPAKGPLRPGEFPSASPSSGREDSRLTTDEVRARIAALKAKLQTVITIKPNGVTEQTIRWRKWRPIVGSGGR